jgi:broad specificity phosphatase PhoE
MEMLTTVAFVRHGKVHNPNDLYYGRLACIKLSQQGQAEAHSAADILHVEPISAVFSSPALRARQTAQIIAATYPGMTVHTTRWLHDVSTPFDGQLFSEVVARTSSDVYASNDPRYEQPFDVMKRTLRFIQLVRRRYPGQCIVAVSHFDIILYMTLRILNIPLDRATIAEYKRTNPFITHGSISKFVYRTEEIDEIPSYEYIDHTTITF